MVKLSYPDLDVGLKWAQQNPIEWAEEVFGIKLDPKQRDLLISLRDNERTDFKTGNEVGKTFGCSVASLQFLYCYAPSTVIITASTDRQIWRQFWPEVTRLIYGARYKLPGRVQTKYINVDPHGKWFLLGFATSDEARFEGYHNKNILLVFDESKGIRADIWRAGERLFRGEGVHKRWIAAGTPPLGPVGEFAQISVNPRKSRLWHHINCSGWDSLRVSDEKCQEALDTYGENHPFYVSMVLGRVPLKTETAILDLEDITLAAAREAECGDHIDEVAVDVARKGDDETVISYRKGWKVFQEIFRGKDKTTWCTLRIKKLLDAQGDAREIPIRVDDIGVGGGVTDQLMDEEYNAIPINVARNAVRSDLYYDLGTEIYAQLGKALKEKPISIPDDPELLAQLYSRVETKLKQKGGRLLFKILSKEELRRDPLHKGNPSPDRADSLAMLLCEIPPPEVPKGDSKLIGGNTYVRPARGGWSAKRKKKEETRDAVPGVMRVGRRMR